MAIIFKDRLDREFSIKANDGDRLFSILSKNHIPVDAIFVRKNGIIIDDYDSLYYEKDYYLIEMVRAYHLPDFLSYLNLWDYNINNYRPTNDSYYTKRLALHSPDDGDFKYYLTRFNHESFVNYLDDTFVDGCNSENLFENGENVLLALSGGRDSLSLGYFLSRNKDKLINFNLRAVHVETSSNKLETSYAQEISDMFNIPLRIFTNEEVTKLYNLNVGILEALDLIKNEYNKSYSIFSAHNIIKACVESYAREIKYEKLIYGLMKEDVVASILKGTFIGQPFRGPLNRSYGDFQIVYPLWPISKKELTLYLEEVNKDHNFQGSPSRFERGALSRDIYYYFIDTLENICPGICYQLIQATKVSTKTALKKVNYRRCKNCGTTYSEDYRPTETSNIEREEGYCDLCNMFNKFGLIKK